MQSAVYLSEILLPEGDAPSELRLFKFGVNQTRKGDLVFDEESAKLVMEDYVRGGNELPFDIGHEMLKASGPTERHEAAGWFKPEVRQGAGGPELWASGIAWCADVAEKIKARKYRYYSPAILTNESKRITRIVNCALTNLPATYGLSPLMASQLELSMMPKLAEMLGMDPATATEEDVMSALSAMMKSYADMKGKMEGGMQPLSDVVDPMKCSEVDELIQLSGVADWKGAIVALSSEIKTLRQEKHTAKVSTVVEDAIKARKLTPAQRESATKLGLASLELLSDFIAAAVSVIPEPSTQPGTKVVMLSAEEQEVCRKLGISEEAYAATKQSVRSE